MFVCDVVYLWCVIVMFVCDVVYLWCVIVMFVCDDDLSSIFSENIQIATC